MGVVLRELPTSVYTVGQTEPRTRVYAPNTQGEKNFQHPFVSYQIAKVLARAEQRGGLEFDEIREKVLPSLQLSAAHFRNRLKPVAVYDKNTQLWTTKSIGADYDDNHDPYPGVDMLGKSIPPEGVAAYEVTCAAQRRLRDLGIQKLFVGAHAVSSVGVTMVYLTGQVAAAKKLSKKAKSNLEIFQKTSQKMSKQNQMVESSSRIKFFELAAEELAKVEKSLLKRHEVAKFIYQELLLAPWHLTGEFIDVHRKGEGIGMMKLTGLGDPSGKGEGFSFIREIDTKPTKTPVQGEADQMKKITGTGDDLRKLNMGEMAAILRKYGMDEKVIKRLQRWDRVHMIRDLSTKAAADGNLDGYGRFARGEKMKLSEQKQRYRDRIQMIWKREIAALSIDSDGVRAAGVDSSGAPSDDLDEAAEAAAEQKKKEDAAAKDDSDSSDSDFDDDLENDLAMNMMEDANAAQSIVADQAQAGGGGDISRDEAIQLAALKRQREEERAAQEGITLNKKMTPEIPMHDRKVIRKRITRTYPDGRQVTTFKFIVHPEEVGEIMARLGQQDSEEHTHKTYDRPEYQADDKPLGHAMFEDDDDFIFTTTGRSSGSRRAMGRRQRGGVVKGQRRRKDFQFGKLKTKVSLDQKLKKRKRAEEEEELYQPTSKLKGTSNRKERGSIRQKKPHVIFADRLEAIRGMIESRPLAGPFLKPVNMRNYPDYYVVISDPIDLATIRDKIQK